MIAKIKELILTTCDQYHFSQNETAFYYRYAIDECIASSSMHIIFNQLKDITLNFLFGARDLLARQREFKSMIIQSSDSNSCIDVSNRIFIYNNICYDSLEMLFQVLLMSDRKNYYESKNYQILKCHAAKSAQHAKSSPVHLVSHGSYLHDGRLSIYILCHDPFSDVSLVDYNEYEMTFIYNCKPDGDHGRHVVEDNLRIYEFQIATTNQHDTDTVSFTYCNARTQEYITATR